MAKRQVIYFSEEQNELLKYIQERAEETNTSLSAYMVDLIQKDKNKNSEIEELKSFINIKFNILEHQINEQIDTKIENKFPF